MIGLLCFVLAVLANKDRRLLIVLYRWFPSILQVLTIIRPETLIHRRRSGFWCYWRWKSRSLGGRPPIEARLRALIRQMSMNNPLWGAPRIHGELCPRPLFWRGSWQYSIGLDEGIGGSLPREW
jgi:hypothetical protein